MEAVFKELKSLFTGADGEIGRKGILKTIWNKVIETIQEAACDYGNHPHTSSITHLLYRIPSMLGAPASATSCHSSSYLFSHPLNVRSTIRVR